MPAGHRERKVEFITIKTHGKQNRLYSLMSQLRNSKSCVIQQTDHIRSPFQSANCIGRIIITMMKSTSVFLERTGKSQSRAATIINPPGERLQILKFFRCIFHHQYTCNTPRSLSIKRVHIDTIHLRFRINLIRNGIPTQSSLRFIQFAGFTEYVFHQKIGQIKSPDTITVMMNISPTTAISNSLIGNMIVHREEFIFHFCSDNSIFSIVIGNSYPFHQIKISFHLDSQLSQHILIPIGYHPFISF